jgi:hypothetical protein
MRTTDGDAKTRSLWLGYICFSDDEHIVVPTVREHSPSERVGVPHMQVMHSRHLHIRTWWPNSHMHDACKRSAWCGKCVVWQGVHAH